MKRKILNAWGIFLTASMLIGSNNAVIAAELNESNSETSTYSEEQESDVEESDSTDSDASSEAEPSESQPATSEEESKEPSESQPASSEESEEPSESQSASSEESEEPSESQPASSEENTESSESQPASSEESKEPSESQSTSSEENKKPSESQSTSSEENKKPSESQPVSSEENKKPSESQPASSEESKESGESQPSASEGESKVPEGSAAGSVESGNKSEEILNGWKEEKGKYYWYEDGVKQGTEEGWKEVYDPESENWYLLDSADNGARVEDKEIYLEADGGKWVRYDKDGCRVSGVYSFEGKEYYYEPVTGARVQGPMVLPDGKKVFYDLETGQMVKGEYKINETAYHFDESDGHLLEETTPEFWLVVGDASYWYVDWVRQGWKPEEEDYVGEEVYDAASDEWFWLDGTEQGRRAVNKLVYLKEGQADEAGNLGKWVFYDENGHMVRGWDAEGLHYYDPVYGTMAKGVVVIGNKEYEFDSETGVKLTEKAIFGFEAYGIDGNVEAGVEYDYITNCYDVNQLRTVGKTVFNYRTFESDETHEAREGYEWKQVTISMAYDSKSAEFFGYQYAVMFDMNYYTFNNDSLATYDSEDARVEGSVISFNGKDYDILTHYEVLEDGWDEEGVGRVTVLYECQVPVGYDGMAITLYNAANIDKGELAMNRLDENSLIFRMQ